MASGLRVIVSPLSYPHTKQLASGKLVSRLQVVLEPSGIVGALRVYKGDLPTIICAGVQISLPSMRWAVEQEVEPRTADRHAISTRGT